MTKGKAWFLPPDRYFDPDPARRGIALELYQAVADLPLICPHGHVNPALFSDQNATFGSPVELLIIPDHYVFRLLYSHGVPLEKLGIRPADGTLTEEDHSRQSGTEYQRQVWQLFADNFYLFRGTPTGIWLASELHDVLGVDEKLNSANAQAIYDHIAARLASPEFRPRALFDRFHIEAIATTDGAGDRLLHHQAIRASGWQGDIRPTFRPDAVINFLLPAWRKAVDALSDASGVTVVSYATLIRALEHQRAFFKTMGATATDQGAQSAYTDSLPIQEAEAIFQRALHGEATVEDWQSFTAHMLMESARMSTEDGLVMQFHAGSVRNHNEALFERFGPDMGADIPERNEFTHNLRPLLNRFGNDPRFSLIVFTLDEAAYSRELAPLAGHYPAMKLGPPWWFHDSPNGMRRYLESVMETAGLHNTVGFNDDTRAFLSIPARHDLWRRICADWLAGLVVRSMVDLEEAHEMIQDLAYRLARQAYHFDRGGQQ
jgi:glucuronate isomerase